MEWLDHGAWTAFILALLCYGLSHLIRALRLVVIAASILPLRVRVLFLLHFHTAAVSLAVPFKLGELYRLHELGRLSGDWGRAELAMVVERAFDAGVLILLCGALLGSGIGLPITLRMTLLVLTAALTVAMFIFFIADPTLAAVQRYIFTHHISPQARLLLMATASFRQGITVARQCIRGQFPLLVLLSAGIWICEALTLAILLQPLGTQANDSFMAHIVISLSSPGAFAEQPYTMAVVFLLFAVWPIATLFYLRYIDRPCRANIAPSNGAPLSAYLQSRRIRLHVPRRLSCPSS